MCYDGEWKPGRIPPWQPGRCGVKKARSQRDLHNYVSKDVAVEILRSNIRTIEALKPGTLVKFSALRVDTWRESE